MDLNQAWNIGRLDIGNVDGEALSLWEKRQGRLSRDEGRRAMVIVDNLSPKTCKCSALRALRNPVDPGCTSSLPTYIFAAPVAINVFIS